MWIKNGRIIDPATKTDLIGDIHIEKGKIAGLYPKGKGPKSNDRDSIDAHGFIVAPGLIDMHVHLRDPGYEYKEDICTGSLAAAAGGLTTIVAMANTDPANDSPAVTKYIVDKAAACARVRVLPVGAATKGLKGEELSEMGLMKACGIIAVSDDGQPIKDASMLRKALEYSSTFGLRLISHPEDESLSGNGVMNEGVLASKLGLPSIPDAAEEVMVSRDIVVSEYTNIPIHLTHISTKNSLDLIKTAKQKGVKVTCDATPHHLLLTENAVATYNTNAKMNPPLRQETDRKALIKGIKDGIIDVIATDHAPHAKDEKDRAFDLAPFGTIGLQTLVPSLLKLHEEEKIDLMKLIACVTINPASILGIDGGTLSPGSRADITIIDPDTKWVFTEDMIKSKSKNSVFLGMPFRGNVAYTIVNGKVVYGK